MKLKINGLKDDNEILWKKMPCTCNKGNVMESHPISRNCKHCCYKQAEDSMPRESFKVNEPIIDKDGKQTGVIVKHIKEITIKRGSHDDIVGWSF